MRLNPSLVVPVSFCALLLGAIHLHAADEPHFPSSEELRHVKTLGGPLLSPDGKTVLFSVTDATADGAKAHLWLVSTSGTEGARQLTFSPPADKRGERSPQWAPDGSAVFFLAHRGEHTQLFRLDLRGGEASPYDLKVFPAVDDSKEKNAIPPAGADKKEAAKPADKKDEAKSDEKKTEDLPIDVSGYAISADSKWMAVWAKDPETPGEKKQKEAKADATWVNHETHGTRLYLAALKADGTIDGSLKVVAVGPDVRSAVWSPAADRLLVIAEPPNEISDLGPASSAWIVDAENASKATKLSAVPATVGGGTWSIDGKSIVFAAQTPEDAPPGYDELYALSPGDAESKPVRLSAGFTGQLNASDVNSTQDGAVISTAGVGTRSAVVRLSLDGKTSPAPVDLGASAITGLNTNKNHSGWVWLAEGGAQAAKLCYAATLGEACKSLGIPDLGTSNLRSVKPEVIRWKSGDFTIEGLLYMPPNASGKAPLIVDVHGGPFGAFLDRYDPFVDFLLGHGWAVLRPNPRGSSNYGVKFGAANKNDLGGGDYQDVMAGVDFALSKYPLDSNRMALMGYSYGGEMAGFVEGKTDRFKAIISGAPVIDQFSEYGTERGSWYDRWYFGKPWEHMEDAWKQSPLSGAARAKTPFMLLQGDSDSTDPRGQAEEMYRALRQEGVPVELVTYPREDHGPLATGIFGRPSTEPWHGFDGRQRIVEFLDKAFGASTASR